jgi:hypothetical protein
MKKCNKCDADLIVGENWTASSKKYYKYMCRDCVVKYGKVWEAEHTEERTVYQRVYQRAYQQVNQGKVNAKNAKHRALKKELTPEMNPAEWAEIEGMYLYNQIMPGKWHVDHVQALNNRGLHHPINLQILSEHDNCSKGDR